MITEAESKRRYILERVCEEFGCTIDDVRSLVRKRNFSNARRVYSYITRTHLKDSFIRIGMELNKDHSSVIEQIQRMEDFIYTKDSVARTLQKIERHLLTKQII